MSRSEVITGQNVSTTKLTSLPFLAICIINLFTAVSFFHFYIYPQILRNFGMSESEIGIAMSTAYASSIVGYPLMARVIRSIGVKATVNCGLLIMAVSSLVLSNLSTLGPILLVRFFQGLGMAAVLSSTNILVAAVIDRARLAQALAVYGAFFVIGQSVGPLVATIGRDVQEGAAWFFVSSAAVAVAAIPISYAIPNVPVKFPSNEHENVISTWIKSIDLLICTCLVSAVFGALTSLLADYATLLGRSNATNEFFLGFLICSLTARFGAGRLFDTLKPHMVVTLGSLAGGLAAAALLFGYHVWAFWTAGILAGLSNSLCYPILQALLIDRLTDKISAVSASRMTVSIGLAGGSIAGGVVAEIGGYSIFLIVFAILAIVPAAIVRSSRTAERISFMK